MTRWSGIRAFYLKILDSDRLSRLSDLLFNKRSICHGHSLAGRWSGRAAHLKLNHGEQSARNEQTGNVMKIFGGVVLGSLGVEAAGLVSDISVTAISTKYSRDNETEADYLGAIWSIEARYESEGAVRLHERIYERSKHHPTPFLSTHPSGPERILKLQQLSNRLSY